MRSRSCFYIECVCFSSFLWAKCKRQYSVPFLSCSCSRVDHVCVFLFSWFEQINDDDDVHGGCIALTARQPSWVCSTSSTVDEFCWQHDRLAVAKFSKSREWDIFQEGRTLFWRHPNVFIKQCSIGRRKATVPKIISIRIDASIEHRHATDGQTDRQTPDHN